MKRKNFPNRKKKRRLKALSNLKNGTDKPSKRGMRTPAGKEYEIQALEGRVK